MKHLLTTLAAALAFMAGAWAQADQDAQHVSSPDGKYIVFVRTLPGKEIGTGVGSPATELWQTGADGKNASLLVRPRESDDMKTILAGFAKPQFSADGRYVFFLSAAWATSGALHVVDTTNGKEHFVCPAWGFEIVRSGEYHDCLLVLQHRYYIGGGAYEGYWLIRPDGKEIGPVSEDTEDSDLAAALKKISGSDDEKTAVVPSEPSPLPTLPAEVKAAPAATATLRPEIAGGIDRTRENAEAENSPYRRMVNAAAAECVERYGKKVAGNLKGVQAICAEYYDATVEEEGTTEGTSAREAENDFYTATLAHLSKLGAIPATVYQKEVARLAAKWSH
jgi:WD40-like Beta Propeller Repeat